MKTIAISRLIELGQEGRLAIPGELCGYLALSVLETLGSSVEVVAISRVLLSEDGSILSLPPEKPRRSECLLTPAQFLVLLIEVSTSVPVALRRLGAANIPSDDHTRALTGALVPLNRSAARRGLARLCREAVGQMERIEDVRAPALSSSRENQNVSHSDAGNPSASSHATLEEASAVQLLAHAEYGSEVAVRNGPVSREIRQVHHLQRPVHSGAEAQACLRGLPTQDGKLQRLRELSDAQSLDLDLPLGDVGGAVRVASISAASKLEDESVSVPSTGLTAALLGEPERLGCPVAKTTSDWQSATLECTHAIETTSISAPVELRALPVVIEFTQPLVEQAEIMGPTADERPREEASAIEARALPVAIEFTQPLIEHVAISEPTADDCPSEEASAIEARALPAAIELTQPLIDPVAITVPTADDCPRKEASAIEARALPAAIEFTQPLVEQVVITEPEADDCPKEEASAIEARVLPVAIEFTQPLSKTSVASDGELANDGAASGVAFQIELTIPLECTEALPLVRHRERSCAATACDTIVSGEEQAVCADYENRPGTGEIERLQDCDGAVDDEGGARDLRLASGIDSQPIELAEDSSAEFDMTVMPLGSYELNYLPLTVLTGIEADGDVSKVPLPVLGRDAELESADLVPDELSEPVLRTSSDRMGFRTATEYRNPELRLVAPLTDADVLVAKLSDRTSWEDPELGRNLRALAGLELTPMATKAARAK